MNHMIKGSTMVEEIGLFGTPQEEAESNQIRRAVQECGLQELVCQDQSGFFLRKIMIFPSKFRVLEVG